MLPDTIDRFDPDFNVVGDRIDRSADRPDRGLPQSARVQRPAAPTTRTRRPAPSCAASPGQAGNEIDEFVTEALRNNLLGLPLDLASINIARGRDTGVPSLNRRAREFYAMTGDSQLKPYTSWADLAPHLKHPESIVNFIAAYGTHAAITSATTLADKRAAATHWPWRRRR